MSDRNLNDLDTDFQPLAQAFLDACASAGIPTKLIVTWRSAADQNEAKCSGLSNAAAGQSPHNLVDVAGNPASKAFDFGVFENDGAYVTDGRDPRYARCAAIAKGLGLAWGGDWHHPDWDHIEMPGWRGNDIGHVGPDNAD